MKISYNWLKQYLKTDWEAEKTGELLTDIGLEVEGIETIESVKGGLKGVVVGEVLNCVQHPNADRLKLTTVDIGNKEPLQIVCGAPNVAAGQKVPVATIGTLLFDADGKEFKIKKGNIRGEESHGMICAEDELGLGTSHDGILVLDSKIKVGTLASDVFDIENDQVFEIGLTPNRADAMSHYGVARDLKAGLKQKGVDLELILPSVSEFHVDDRTLKIDVEVQDLEKAPRYCGVTISEIKVEESPKWLQKRLKAIGLKPINNIVDITNFVLHELGQPLHAFDASKVKKNKVIVKTLANKTKFTTLDEVKRKLHEEDLMICNGNEEPMCIAGVFGGIDSGVTENTSSIFLESAYFNSIAIRKTAKRHALNTDASFRFERGIDPNMTEHALKRAANLIIEIAGGKISSEIVDIYPNKIEDFEVFLSYDRLDRLVGAVIPREVVKSIIASLDIKLKSETDGGLGLTVPSYRVDVTREADIIEEILRIYGYNNVEFSDKLNTSISFSDFDEVKVENTIANQLVALGFNETMANSLTKPDYNKLTETIDETKSVTILNPLSNDLSIMRQSLLFSGLESVIFNINRKNNEIKFFEFGKSYHHFESGYQEDKHLTLFVSGNKNKESWNTDKKAVDFYYLKGIVTSLLQKVGTTKLKTSPTKNDIFSEGITLSLGKVKLVDLGLVKASILSEFDIKQEVLFADFNWENILKISKKNTVKIKSLPKFPSVRRDLALLIDKEITFSEIYNIAFQAERNLLTHVDLFDVYEGDKLPTDKKSYAVSFMLQDENKTLNDKIIDATMDKLLKSFEKNIGASLR